jgi:WD40 repeat protein
LALDGNDLAVIYGVAFDDNAGGVLGGNRPNYLAFRRIAGFRTALVPEKPDGRYLISANGGAVKRYWLTKGGEWLPGGNFASGTYAGVAFSLEVAIAATGNAVYVGGEGSKGRIFVFDRKGVYRRTLEMPDALNGKIDSIQLAANGRDLIVTDAFAKQAVYRVDPSSGTWTEIVSSASTAGTDGALGGRVRGAIEAPDGTLYVAANKGVFAFDANGNLVAKLAGNAHVGLALDTEGNRLFYSGQDGAITKVDLTTGEKTVIQNRSMGANSALQLIWHKGRLLAADARNYYAYSVNPDALNEEEVFLFGFESFSRFAFIDENFQPGIVIRLK